MDWIECMDFQHFSFSGFQHFVRAKPKAQDWHESIPDRPPAAKARRMKFARYLVMTALLTGVAARALSASGVEMILTRVPEGGLQPQALVGSDGTLHLIYFRGDPKAGDLFYARRATGSGEFTKPIRVNAQPGAAIAIGT